MLEAGNPIIDPSFYHNLHKICPKPRVVTFSICIGPWHSRTTKGPPKGGIFFVGEGNQSEMPCIFFSSCWQPPLVVVEGVGVEYGSDQKGRKNNALPLVEW